jgi:exonuclease 3'-5' domain-containing protein 1
LADVHTLGDSAFNTAGQSGKTLKAILQDPAITKVFFNVRNDSDALYAHYGIALQGVEDVQLMENAARTYRDRQYLCGLSKCIERDAPLSRRTKAEWQAVKSSGERLFSPDRGGSYAVFNTRPLSEELKAYCIGDVQHLPLLRNTYWPRLTAAWRQRLLVETRRRVSDSHMPNYRPHGLEKKFGPWPDERG